jgi:hypothetical protein
MRCSLCASLSASEAISARSEHLIKLMTQLLNVFNNINSCRCLWNEINNRCYEDMERSLEDI